MTVKTDFAVRQRALSVKLAMTLRQMHRRFDQHVANLGLTRSQWTMVAVIAGRPGVTQREAAKELDISEAAAGRIIDRLCADGVLERQPKSDDRRAYAVQTTAKGKELISRISAVAAEHEAALFTDFAEDDYTRFAVLLDKLAANANAPRPAVSPAADREN